MKLEASDPRCHEFYSPETEKMIKSTHTHVSLYFTRKAILVNIHSSRGFKTKCKYLKTRAPFQA